MDAAWPKIADAVLSPVLGPLTDQLATLVTRNNQANSGGSAYAAGWYGYVWKDLRSLIGQQVDGPYSTQYCGAGNLQACRARSGPRSTPRGTTSRRAGPGSLRLAGRRDQGADHLRPPADDDALGEPPDLPAGDHVLVAPSALSVAERYVLLGLRLGRHVDGLVDAFFGPAELKEQVDGEEPADPGALIDEVRALRGELDAVDDAQRRSWLEAQLEGLECVGEMVSGKTIPWRESVRRCYGLDVEPAPEEVFAAAHEKLEAALPGDGDLAARLDAWNETQTVPADKLLPAFGALVDELREETRRFVELPDVEGIEVELVTGKPWAAFNWYLGDLRSRVSIATDLPVRSYFLPVLAAHEVYPGHHTEHACKEAGLVRELGRIEATITLVHTPECVVSEGIAQVAIEQAFGEDWIERAAQIVRPHGVDIDVETARAVVDANELLEDVDVNIAYYAAEEGWTEDEAVAYHRKWRLSNAERARKSVSFDMHPLWSPYVPTYSYGHRLVRDYVAAGEGNFERLLTEQLTTADLLDSALRTKS